MSNSESRVDVMKQLLIKACIPTALSVGAYIIAKFISKPYDSISEPSSTRIQHDYQENETLEDSESFHSVNSSPYDVLQCKNELTTKDSQSNLDNKLLELESQLEDFQHKEFELESRYLRYRVLKGKELMLTEIRNEMLVEKVRAEFLLKEIYLEQEENKRVGNLVLSFIELYYDFQKLKNENLLLGREVRQQKLEIDSKNEELLRNEEEIRRRDCVIQEFEDEVKELKVVLDHLQREKIELTLNKVEITNSVTKQEYETVLKEIEQLNKDSEAQEKEISYLKRSNEFLRHELLRYHEQQELNKDDSENRVIEYEIQDHENENNNVTSSKRLRFMKKIKKWVDGGQTDGKEKNEIKCEEVFVPARISCSSV